MLSIKNMTSNSRLVPILIVGFTLVFRILFLAIKPPHFDEGVNGWFVDEMMKSGYYHYDPANYHGPLHFYILFMSQLLFGRSLWAIRLPIVIISACTVFLVTLFDRFMDKRTCWLAAAAMAVSPAMEFYGRYAIHESEFVLFLILLVWGAWGVARFGTMQYLWAAALGITGMILTKETYVIHVTAFVLAGGCLWFLERFIPSTSTCPPAKQDYTYAQLFTVGGVCAALIIFFYSGAFLDFEGLRGLYLTFSEWAKTGQEGHGHEKTEYDLLHWTLHHGQGKNATEIPIAINYYWFALIFRYEWPVLIGLVASIFYIWPKKDRFIRYIAIYGWGALAAYSLIRYKTPWCIITIIWPFFFVFGDVVKDLLDALDRRPALPRVTSVVAACVIFLGLLLPASLAWSVRLNFFRYTNDDEPYVYVQTFKDIDKLTKPLFALARRDPANYHMKGSVVLDSYHPLPWVLGDFTNIGWYDQDRTPDEWDADFLLVDDSRIDEAEKALKHDYFTEKLRLRSSMDPSKLYLSYEKFHTLFPNRKPEFTQGKATPAGNADSAAAK